MIRYQLICECKHQFDSWFRSSDDFDRQKENGLLACPCCGGGQVAKALMAPNLSTTAKKHGGAGDESREPGLRDGAGGEPSASDAKKLRAAIREMRAHVTKNADYVGSEFTTVARDMHYGDAPERGIYGEAKVSDVKALKDEGINVLPLPSLPEEKN